MYNLTTSHHAWVKSNTVFVGQFKKEKKETPNTVKTLTPSQLTLSISFHFCFDNIKNSETPNSKVKLCRMLIKSFFPLMKLPKVRSYRFRLYDRLDYSVDHSLPVRRSEVVFHIWLKIYTTQ